MENINVLTFDIIGIPVGDFSKFALIIIMFSMGLNLSFDNFGNIFALICEAQMNLELTWDLTYFVEYELNSLILL